ncbi:NLI interacting factor-like phosphatase-domain-containing protein [Schizophyllum commune]
MNSLTYLSRQFDVLAAPHTPPSTPTAEHTEYALHNGHARYSAIPRVKTWTKSFLFPQYRQPPNPSPPSRPPRRTMSSPADFITLASLQESPLYSTTPPASDEASTSTKAPAPTPFEAEIRRIFLIRICLLVWRCLCMAWTSLSGAPLAETPEKRSREGTEELSSIGGSTIADSDSDGTDEEAPPLVPKISLHRAPHLHSIPGSRTASDPIVHLKPPETQATTSQSATEQAPSVPASGSCTPPARKTPFHRQKTLVLDLDETLIHSTSRPLHHATSGGFFGLSPFGRRNKGAAHTVEVMLGGKSTLYHVYKRPFVDFFLRTVSGWYTLVIFTASMPEYADPVIDWLDAGRGILARRLFRDSCTQLPNGSYTKDLALVEADLSCVCLIDNSPVSYKVNEANGIPIEGWTHDPYDEALLDLLPVLDSLRFTSDVRRVLGLRCVGGSGR